MLGVERPLSVVQFTSSFGSEGKSTTVANFAAVLAQTGQRIVVVDCDLRKPRLGDFYEIDGEKGVTTVLSGALPLAQALQPVQISEFEITVLPSGVIPPNPSELLASKRMAELIFELQSTYDVLLLDSPPVLAVTDATALSSWVDGVILVAAAGVAARKPLRRTIETLRQSGAPLVGVVFNQTGPDETRGYGYGYGYVQDTKGRRNKRR